MIPLATAPGLAFSVAPRVAEASPLRSDVAGFIGRTRRGVVGKSVRVEGWRGYLREFGGLLKDSSTTYAIRGYFENGGEVAYVVRVCGQDSRPASEILKVGELNSGKWSADSPSTFEFAQYRIEATSPGEWANDTRVSIRYRFRGPSGNPEVDITVETPGEPRESFTGLPLDGLENAVGQRSLLIRLIPDLTPGVPSKTVPIDPGPNHIDWNVNLKDGIEAVPTKQHYLDAVTTLGEGTYVESETLVASGLEVAMVAVPGIYEDLPIIEDYQDVLAAVIDQAEKLHDRLVLVDVPPDADDTDQAIRRVNAAIQRDTDNAGSMRAAAIYHPRLWVPDPLGDLSRPLRSVSPSGHVAGLMSRLDRERGAHHTPANATLFETVDVTKSFDPRERARFLDEGINLVRCFPGRGLVVWGGRTADRSKDMHFVAHRRLIHRLIRVIRRVAEPLVFDINGPELRLTIVRAITTALLEAWRGGALKGARPDEAFRVRCDEKTTPPQEEEAGRIFCEIEVAPAVPMEFILLQVALSADGVLEVIE